MQHLIPSLLLCLALAMLPASRLAAAPVEAQPISVEEAVLLNEQQEQVIADLQQLVAGDNKTIWVGALLLGAVAAAAIITATQ
jgi:hypothetical protein